MVILVFQAFKTGGLVHLLRQGLVGRHWAGDGLSGSGRTVVTRRADNTLVVVRAGRVRPYRSSIADVPCVTGCTLQCVRGAVRVCPRGTGLTSVLLPICYIPCSAYLVVEGTTYAVVACGTWDGRLGLINVLI